MSSLSDIAMTSAPGPARTMEESRRPQTAWSQVVASPEFETLIAAKKRAITTLLCVSLGFFVLVSLLCGFARAAMTTPVFGSLGLGYVLVVLVYLVCWVGGILYVAIADTSFDDKAGRVLARLRGDGGAS